VVDFGDLDGEGVAEAARGDGVLTAVVAPTCGVAGEVTSGGATVGLSGGGQPNRTGESMAPETASVSSAPAMIAPTTFGPRRR
jgi:hypothetical protein